MSVPKFGPGATSGSPRAHDGPREAQQRRERWSKYFGDAVLSYRMDMRIPPLTTPEEVAPFAAERRPTLILGADDDVSFPGHALVARAKELFPHAEVGVFEARKHRPPFEDAFRAKMAERVHDFLARSR